VGGIRVNEPAADLGMALAMASSLRNVGVRADLVVLGEIGLSGELRAVSQLEKRLSEAVKLGFKSCLVPPLPSGQKAPAGIELIPVGSVSRALKLGLEAGPANAS
jgi:DNA repair protein RadA/Sms